MLAVRVFSPSARKLERFHRKTVQKRSVYFLTLPNVFIMLYLQFIFNLYTGKVNVNPVFRCKWLHEAPCAKICLVHGRSLPLDRGKVDGFNKKTTWRITLVANVNWERESPDLGSMWSCERIFQVKSCVFLSVCQSGIVLRKAVPSVSTE